MATMRVSSATCSLCEASCGLSVRHDGRNIESIRGDAGDPFSHGFICPKAVALKDIHEDPDRLTAPLARRAGKLEPVSLEDAVDRAARSIVDLQSEHGADAMAIYTGNPLGHSYAGVLGATLLGLIVGGKSRYSAQSVDALPRLVAMFHMYGNQAILSVPDLPRTDYLLVFGANPVVSNGSVMTMPNARQRLRDLRARGGKLVVVDPRRSETAREADEHLFIQPGSDVLVLLGMLHTIFDRGWTRLERLAGSLEGVEQVRRAVRSYSPERVAGPTGMSAADIERLARDFAQAERAAIYGRMGVCTQSYGGLCSWLIEVLNIVTGNLDREGGAMFNTPAVDLPGVAKALGRAGSYATFRSRVAGLPEFAGELPVAAFADEMETPGAGQIRGLLTIAGNPVLSLPNGRRLDAAFAKLDFMASIDIYLNETTRHAGVILPTTFGLERDDYPLLASAMGVENRAKYAPALLEPAPGLRSDWQVMASLAAAILEQRGSALAARALRAALAFIQPQHVLDLMVRLGPHGFRTRSKLKLSDITGHGQNLGLMEPRLSQVVATRSGKVELAPALFLDDLPRVERLLEPKPDVAELRLIGRRQLRNNNSWMHNAPSLVSGKPRCTLLMHPRDADRLGLREGDSARLSSRVGSIEVPVEVSDELMPGVISLPHGFGHDRDGMRMRIASAHAGVSINDITDERAFDALSGTTDFNGVKVKVERVEARAAATASALHGVN